MYLVSKYYFISSNVFAVFMVIKAINSAKKKEEAAPSAPPAPSKQEVLLSEIRDLLKK